MTYADTSFLFSIYVRDAHTPRALEWVRSAARALHASELTDYELRNAVRFTEFRGALAAGAAARFLAQYECDRAEGRIVVPVCNLASVVNTARRLSAHWTLSRGHRSLDILNVAAALERGAAEFLTFDSNQRTLAEAEGLRVPV